MTWRDACSLNGWAGKDEVTGHGPSECLTMGYLMSVTKKEVKVGQSINDVGHVGNLMAIPREWVVKIETFKRRKS